MKSHDAFIAVAALLFCLSIEPVIATPNHSLQWGVDTNEQFTYALQRKLGNSSWIGQTSASLSFISAMDEGQKATAVVTSLGLIPDTINSSYDMPNSFCALIRENDSTQLATNFTLFVVPIGDWGFLTQMSGFTSGGWTVINTDTEWGATLSLTIEDGDSIAYYQELRYEKQNGTLNYLRLRLSSLGNALLDIVFVQWHPGMPTVLSPELQLSTTLTVLLGVAVASVASVIVYKKHTGRKSIAQRLGE
jgi:hypothetical protein